MIEELNPIEAVEMYKKAIAIDGNSDSMFNMALLYYTNKDEAEWHKEAIQLMTRAAASGNIKAQEYLEDNEIVIQEKPID